MRFHFFSSMLVLSTAFFATVTQAAQDLDSIVVEINRSIITESELQKRVGDIRQQLMKRRGNAPTNKQLRNKVLDRMVQEMLQIQRASQYGIKLSKAGLNKRIEALAQQNKMTVHQLKQALANDGVNFLDFREQIRRDTIIRRAQKQLVIGKIKISEHEIKQFLADNEKDQKDSRYRLAHILITVPEAANSEQLQQARKKIENILQQLKAGKGFEQLAVEYSSGQQALEGGDLGWRSAAELPSMFLQAARGLSTGEVSEIIQTPSGYHLLKLVAKQSAEKVVVEEVLARHILIKVDQLTNDEQARTKLEEVHQQLKEGADFAEMAKRYSQDIGSKGTGGELGWSIPDTYTPQFKQVINSLEKNQLSRPFRSEFGWHIAEVLDRRQSDKTEIVARNKAFQSIQSSKADEALELWLRRLRDEAFIKYHNAADKPE